jgi:hypothetical protein
MINKKVTLRLAKVLENVDAGVLECWSIGVLKKDVKPLAITPLLQYGETVSN